MPPLTNSPQELLRRTSAPEAALLSFSPFDDVPPVHAIQVDNSNAGLLWAEMQPLLAGSGYQAIVTCFFGGWHVDWQASVQSQWPQEFGRSYFEEEVRDALPGMGSSSVAAVLSAANVIESSAVLREHLSSLRVHQSDIDYELERLRRTHGSAPDAEVLELAMLDAEQPAVVSFQKALFNWELRSGPRPPKASATPWFEPTEPMALLLLPIAAPEHSLAFMHWWGSFSLGSPATIATLSRWRRDFGAQLVCHFGTMLQLQVERPPNNPTQAFELAMEFCALSQTGDISETAWQLMDTSRWFLHNRP